MVSLRARFCVGAGVLLLLGLASSTWAGMPRKHYGVACATAIPELARAHPHTTKCPSGEHEGVRKIKWTLDPEKPPPGPAAESISAAIHERACTGGRNPIPHLEAPEVDYLKRAIVITLWIHPPKGVNLCPGNPIGHLEVKLPGPLGARRLYDGATDPPRKVKPGEDPRRLRTP